MDKVKVYSDIYKLSRAGAEFFTTRAERAIEARDCFSVALSGGSTPETLLALLATESFANRIDWSKVHVFWGDERCVPPEHTDSNYRMAYYALLHPVNIPEENVHRIEAEEKPEEAAANYEALLREFFGDEDNNPRFDFVLLGLGTDGHTASLFPDSSALEAQDNWVVANYVEKLRAWRVTLTAHALNAAAHIVFLVSGSEKAPMTKQAIEGTREGADDTSIPAQLIQPRDGQLIWLLDEDAAALLG